MSSVNPTLTSSGSDRAFFVFTAVVSAVALGVIGWLLLFHRGVEGTLDLRFMPAVNAGLNATAAALLVAGWFAVKSGHRRAHKFLMVGAFAMSALFLVGYLAYHYVHGDTRYPGVGLDRTFYLVVLATHVVLSMVVPPGALLAFWFAGRRAFDRHKKVTRWLLPVWIYVSITGVLIFAMLRAAGA